MGGCKLIIGIGCDLIEISRIEKALANPRFAQKVFTVGEIQYCQARGIQKNQSYAARYAAKEAVSKAFGTGFRGGSLLDIEVVNNSMGKPEIKLKGVFATLAEECGCKNIYLSISHVKACAMAQVVVEG